MRLPVCTFDLESNMLCTNCQDRLDNGEITPFDIEFSKWFLPLEKDYPELADLHLLRAIQIEGRLILVVKKRQKELLLSLEELTETICAKYGDIMVFEAPMKLRKLVHELIAPAVEVGVNSLYLPNGERENIVMLRDEDRSRIRFTKEELRKLASSILGESVLFEFQGDRVKKQQEEAIDEFDRKMREMSSSSRRVR
jgi:hypothetical protein